MHEGDRLARRTASDRFWRGWRRSGRRLLLGEVGSVWIVPLAAGAAYAPIPGLRTLSSASDAGQFLQVLWQVEAAALALSLAIVIFAFQAVYATRLRGSLRQFAEETGLFPIFCEQR
jgi:hypothetical protein